MGGTAQNWGLVALKKAEHAGRRARLRPEDLWRIEKGLKRGPEALGYETSLWTAWRVAHLIEKECGVKYHPVQAWRILHKMKGKSRAEAPHTSRVTAPTRDA